MLLCPIIVAMDSAEELDKTGLLKMTEGREKFKLGSVNGAQWPCAVALSGFEPSSNPTDRQSGC